MIGLLVYLSNVRLYWIGNDSFIVIHSVKSVIPFKNVGG